jgi:hypothetical protein
MPRLSTSIPTSPLPLLLLLASSPASDLLLPTTHRVTSTNLSEAQSDTFTSIETRQGTLFGSATVCDRIQENHHWGSGKLVALGSDSLKAIYPPTIRDHLISVHIPRYILRDTSATPPRHLRNLPTSDRYQKEVGHVDEIGPEQRTTQKHH